MMHWIYTAAGLLIPVLVTIACLLATLTWRPRRLSRASSTEESPLRAVFDAAAVQSTLCGLPPSTSSSITQERPSGPEISLILGEDPEGSAIQAAEAPPPTDRRTHRRRSRRNHPAHHPRPRTDEHHT